MKIPLFVLLLIISVSSANAIDSSGYTQKEKEFIGTMMEDYSTTAGGWYLNEKCQFLSEELSKSFDSDVSANTIGMQKFMRVKKEVLVRMQHSAQKAAASDKYPCDEKTRGMIARTALIARDLRQTLTNIAENYPN